MSAPPRATHPAADRRIRRWRAERADPARRGGICIVAGTRVWHGLFIEDTALLALAELPFAREYPLADA